jgi:hypothetical protein
MKLASLMRYFEMGIEAHRALDDCRQTVEVLKRCATLLFLEEHGHTFPTPAVPPKSTSVAAPSTPSNKPAPAAPAVAAPAAVAAVAAPSTPLKKSISNVPDAAIVSLLNNAIEKKEPVWVSYDGGSNARMPRKMTVLRWSNEPLLFMARCHISNSDKNFSTWKVLDVRAEYWNVDPPQTFTPLKTKDGEPANDDAPAAPAAPAPAVAEETSTTAATNTTTSVAPVAAESPAAEPAAPAAPATN